MQAHPWWALGLLGLACLYAFISAQINQAVPFPYMDELFHVRQTQEYCKLHFSSWDPMITTFPGLYLIFVPYSFTSSLLTSDENCVVSHMRALNVIFGLANLFLFYKMVGILYPNNSQGAAATRLLATLLLHLFPLQFFFYFLYYTDTVSTFFIMLCYLLALQNKPTLSTLAGGVAVLCRQTNIVWVTFSALSIVLKQYYQQYPFKSAQQQTGFLSILRDISNFAIYCAENCRVLVRQLYLFIILLVSFLVFVYLNQGIVVGDRSQHEPQLHLVQFFYFIAFSSFWLAPRIMLYLWRERSRVARTIFSKSVAFGALVFILAALFIINKFTLVHEYLLADNRHYPFYIWKNFFKQNELLKYVYSPVYFVACFFLWNLLAANGHLSPLWRCLWFGCAAAVIVPAKLLEFRYFIVGFQLLSLHTLPLSETSGEKSKKSACSKKEQDGALWVCLSAELCLYVLVNTLTLCVFLWRPFSWPHGEVARWMW